MRRTAFSQKKALIFVTGALASYHKTSNGPERDCTKVPLQESQREKPLVLDSSTDETMQSAVEVQSVVSCWLLDTGFRPITGFVGPLFLAITNGYNTITNVHTIHITTSTAHAKSSVC
jgi:hypothetical protein